MGSTENVEAQREELLARWEDAAAGWSRRADRVREMGMAVSVWMIDHVRLQPGRDVLELAAGPGDTGFLAAELISPGGTLISSDGTEAMLEVARGRARELGIDNVEFKRLELEWIDLPAASVDVILCRWGVTLSVDPAAALIECRRVLRPGGSLTAAVWDGAPSNPWATIATEVLVQLGHMPPPDPNAPGMFSLSAPGRLAEMLADAGFADVRVEAVALSRPYPSVEEYLAETRDLSRMFSDVYEPLSETQRAEVWRETEKLAAPFQAADGSLELPGRSLVAAADA
ncbi:MAG: methyltransferase domain-containing protein [Solirubrobacteraceae bacterium]